MEEHLGTYMAPEVSAVSEASDPGETQKGILDAVLEDSRRRGEGSRHHPSAEEP